MSLYVDPQRPENLVKWAAATRLVGHGATVVLNDHSGTATGTVTAVELDAREARVKLNSLADSVPLSHVCNVYA